MVTLRSATRRQRAQNVPQTEEPDITHEETQETQPENLHRRKMAAKIVVVFLLIAIAASAFAIELRHTRTTDTENTPSQCM